MSVAVAFRSLINSGLRATPSVAVGGRFYDVGNVPAKPTFPYVTFGAYSFTPNDADCIFAGEHVQMIDVWSRKRGREEALTIVDAIRAAIRQHDADMGAYGLVEIDVDFADVIIDPDGETQHGRVQVRALIEEPANG